MRTITKLLGVFHFTIYLCILIMLVFPALTLAQTDPDPHYLYSIPLDPFLVGNAQKIAWSPDGKNIALGGLGVHVYDFENGEFDRLENSSALGGPASIAWSPSGSELAGAGTQVVIWETSSWKIINTVGEKYRYRFYMDVDWPTVNMLIAPSIGLEDIDWAIRVWDTESAKLLLQIHDDVPPPDSYGDTGFISTEFVPVANIVLGTAGTDRLVRGWDVTSGELVLTIEVSHNINEIKADDNSQQVAISSYPDNTVSIWDVSNKELVETIHTEDALQSIEWNPKNNTLAILDSTHLYIWSEENGLQSVSEIWDLLIDADWNPDGKLLALLTNEDILVFGFG